jgi:hypothetical protein
MRRGVCRVRFERKVEFGDLVGEEIGEGLGKRRGLIRERRRKWMGLVAVQ